MLDLSLDAFPKNSTGHELADLIFVHGIGGHPLKTWLPGNYNQNGFWLERAAADQPMYRVWSLGYPAARTMWDRRGSFAPPQRAASLLVYLDAKKLGARPLVFIAHSLGGLVVKQLLRVAHDSPQSRLQRFAGNTSGIIFIATPHLGADIATVADKLRIVVRLGKALEDLKTDGPYLDDLKHWFNTQATKHNWRIMAFREGRKVKYGFMVVEPSSADPVISGVRPIDIDAEHITICQPTTRENAIYEDTKAFLQELGQTLSPEALRHPWWQCSSSLQRQLILGALKIMPAKCTRSITASTYRRGSLGLHWAKRHS
jgi:pimeloyl-ACP methyl ester carboxylesterase